MTSITDLLTSRWYGALFVTAGTGLLLAALFYQYFLGEEPCQVCIHARLWVTAWILSGLIILLLPQHFVGRSLGHLSVIAAGIGLAERALYLYRDGRDTLYRIHGTTEPWTIGMAVSNGCVRMVNEHVEDLYERVPIGTRVVVEA